MMSLRCLAITKFRTLTMTLVFLLFGASASRADMWIYQPADDVIGQSTDWLGTTPTFNRGVANNGGVTPFGMNRPAATLLDSVNHRFFVADQSNNRVLVYNLNTDNSFPDHIADFVLGQPDFTTNGLGTTSSIMYGPVGLALDSSTNRLFVSDGGNSRVLVFDVTTITSGQDAINVLGQTGFTLNNYATTQSGMSSPGALAFDSSTNRLFVTDAANNRVMVFDVASITDGENAVDVLGQTTDWLGTTPSYTQGTADNGTTNPFGFKFPRGTLLDSVHHRFFVADYTNNRVLVYNLNTDNSFPDRVADFVLGQPDFRTTTPSAAQAKLSGPQYLAYDSTGNRLFVSDYNNSRVMVFNVSTITNGQNAINVLGQTTFTGYTGGTTQAKFNGPEALAFDSATNRLFVAEYFNNRVLVFDVASITDGENAVNVLGQTLFTTSTSATTQAGMLNPQGLAFDSAANRLFVAEYGNNRVLVFDVTSITNGQNAVNVLGQANFTASTGATTQAGLKTPEGLTYDSTNKRLFVADYGNARISVFDVTSITDGENAINVLGQTTFTAGSAGTTQAKMSGPMGITFDSSTNRLFVPESPNNRILVFDVAAITDGENAVDVLGQSTDWQGTTPTYTQDWPNNGATAVGFNQPLGISLDSVNHRFFISDNGNHRVLVYNLNTDNSFPDYIADFVLGQSNLVNNDHATTQAGIYGPQGLAFDSSTNRLFVAEYNNNRVLVFDVASITNGENAISVLGQTSFTVNTAGTTQAKLSKPVDVTFDASTDRLFVADNTNNRVMAFDVAAITDGENAVDVLGQSSDWQGTTPIYTQSTANNGGTTPAGLNQPGDSLLDSANHRFFVADYTNNRVLVYNLNTDDSFPDRIADFVLGQPDFITKSTGITQAKMNGPLALAFDSANNRLFVADYNNSRVLVYDVATITNGQNAINVLGQTNFTTSTGGTTQAKLNKPQSLAFDASASRLFVGEFTNNRVTVFDVASITDGENAINVLGQPDFTTNTAGVTQAKMKSPRALAFDSATNRLFVAEITNNRILVFDVASITDGENAINVLGQTNFTTNALGKTQSKMAAPQGLAFDPISNRLFVSEGTNNRVLIFDVASITNGENSICVLGQDSFTSSSAGATQSTLFNPQGMVFDSSKGRLFVTDTNSSRILIFNAQSLTSDFFFLKPR